MGQKVPPQHLEDIRDHQDPPRNLPVILLYRFSNSKTYIIPHLGDQKSYLSYVDNLPIRDEPEVFGMHENANINYQSQESNRMMETILSIQPRVSGGY